MSETDRRDRELMKRLERQLNAGTVDKPALLDLLDAGVRPKQYSHGAPITDKMEVEELRLGHDRIRLRRTAARITAIAAAVAAVTLAGASVFRILIHSRAEPGRVAVAAGSSARVTSPAPGRIDQPAPSESPVVRAPSLAASDEAAGSSQHMDARTQRRAPSAPHRRYAIVPPKTRRTARKGTESAGPSLHIARADHVRRGSSVHSKPHIVAGTTVHRSIVARAYPAVRPSRPVRIARESATRSRRSSNRPTFTPMHKERRMASAEPNGARPAPASTTRRPVSEVRNAVEDPFDYRLRAGSIRLASTRDGSALRAPIRAASKPRSPTEPMVECRICRDTRTLAGDRCLHIVKVMMRASEVPTRTCSLHGFQ
jgi:hypothetical protein